MRCSTCGELLQPGSMRCPTCGAATPVGMALARPAGVRRCSRCSYQGEGIPYFRRGGHLGLLIGVSVFTYGFGGLVYWLARRKHLVCPRCGLGWENASRALMVTGPAAEQRLVQDEPADRLPGGGIKRRILGTIGVLIASLMILIGFVEFEMVAVAVGSVIGASGSLMYYWGWNGQQDRRKAIMQRMQRQVLRLAAAKGGTLTVTEVATELNLALPAAEKILMSMDDDLRVRSVISEDGVIVYEFPELRHRKELSPGA
jgi:hypothetical protein